MKGEQLVVAGEANEIERARLARQEGRELREPIGEADPLGEADCGSRLESIREESGVRIARCENAEVLDHYLPAFGGFLLSRRFNVLR